MSALQKARPETLAQAARVPGVTPASVQVLSFWMAGPRRQRGASRLPNES
jgi:tRNA U34 5-carboxymethylaminomethyl modifying enzyme MnmG/GidA